MVDRLAMKFYRPQTNSTQTSTLSVTPLSVNLGQGLQTGEGGHRGNSSSPDEFRMALIVLESYVTNNNNNDLRRLGLTRTPKICRGVSSHNITYISKE